MKNLCIHIHITTNGLPKGKQSKQVINTGNSDIWNIWCELIGWIFM